MLYRKPLEKKTSKTIYLSYIYFYMNYVDIVWATMYPTELKRVNLKAKHST